MDSVSNKQISGWACYASFPDVQINIRVEINSKDIFFVKANEYREDVKNANMHPTGLCGFKFQFPEGYQLKKGDVIRLIGEGDYEDINNSPFIV